MNLISVVFLLVCLGKGAFSLECYKCDNCGKFSLTTEKEECSFGYDQCYKEIEDDGDVNRGCTNTLLCEGKKISPGICIDEDVKPCYLCCQDQDNCNSASTKTISLMMGIAPLIVLLLRYLA